jgi:hypothetical protein
MVHVAGSATDGTGMTADIGATPACARTWSLAIDSVAAFRYDRTDGKSVFFPTLNLTADTPTVSYNRFVRAGADAHWIAVRSGNGRPPTVIPFTLPR